MNDITYIAEFAENLWDKYIKHKLTDVMQDDVRFYKAQVTNNPGNGKLVVQKPFETPVTIACSNDLRSVAVGTMVTVLVFGSGNAANHVAVSAQGMKDLSISGGGSLGADYIIESGSGKTGLNTTLLIAQGSMAYWHKWNSGKLEIWGQSQFGYELFIDTPGPLGGYVSGQRFTPWGTWPVPFTTCPSVTCDLVTNEQDGASNYIQMIRCLSATEGGALINPLTQSPYYVVWTDEEDNFYYQSDFPSFAFSAVGRWK